MATVGLLRTLRHLPLCVYQSLNSTAKSSPHLVHKWTSLARPFSSKTATDPKKSVSKATVDPKKSVPKATVAPKKSVSKPTGLPKQPKGGKKGTSQACKTPKRIGFPKQHRGGMKGISYQGNDICFGKYALQVLEPAWITARQIEAGRRAMLPSARRGGKIWVRIFADKPVTEKPTGKRMGSGKGDPTYNVAVVKPGRIIYEMSGVAESIARRAIKIAASKMHIRTQFILSG